MPSTRIMLNWKKKEKKEHMKANSKEIAGKTYNENQDEYTNEIHTHTKINADREHA